MTPWVKDLALCFRSSVAVAVGIQPLTQELPYATRERTQTTTTTPQNKTFFQPAMYLFDKENLTKSPITS